MADFDFSFKHPTTIQISGPTLCGKTRLLLEILKEQLVQPFPHRIIWVFSEWQPDYEEARQCYPHISLSRSGMMRFTRRLGLKIETCSSSMIRWRRQAIVRA